MKKIFISFAAIFVLILNVAVPFKTYAVYNNRSTTKQEFNYDSFIRSTDKYIFMNYDNNNNNDTCACLIRIPENVLSNSDYVTLENNCLIVDCPSNMFAMCIKTQYANNSEYNLSYLKVDFNTDTVEFKFFYNGQLTTPSAVYNAPYYGMNVYQFYNFDSDIDLSFSNDYNISVSFSPVLSGNVDRKDSNGNTLESFRMIVDNYSNFDVQILMTIVKHGSAIGFYNPSLGGTLSLQRVIVSGNPIFTWWKDTPNYTFDSTITEEQNFVHAHHPDVSTFYEVEKQYGPCPWHMVGASNGHLVQDFDWSQINLEDHGNYDVLVYAVRNDHGIPSRQALSNSYDYYVDYSDIQLVYSSNFTLTNPYIYDSNNKNHGNYALMNDVLLSSTSKEYIDSNGEVHQGKELNDLLNKQKEREGQWYSDYSSNIYSDTEYYSSSSVPSSFKNSYNSFISFVTHIFNGFPGDIKTIYFYSFLGICVLGIIKRVT